MNIVLIGYRGTGKSEVGKLLAEELDMELVGMDAEIVRRAGTPIPEIVENFGWPGFRDRESELARDLSGRDGIIVDTGGGIIERPENIEALKTNAMIFWLKASVHIIVNRIQGDTERPALTEGKTFTEEVSEVLEVRTPKYKRASQFEIDTDDMSPAEVSQRILDIFRQEKSS